MTGIDICITNRCDRTSTRYTDRCPRCHAFKRIHGTYNHDPMLSEEKFWSLVHKTDGCFLWVGRRNRKGYGVEGHNCRDTLMHRFSWELHNGPIPDGMFICHACDNPPCVNPAHLFLGTNQDNVDDKMKKGRWRNRKITT